MEKTFKNYSQKEFSDLIACNLLMRDNFHFLCLKISGFNEKDCKTKKKKSVSNFFSVFCLWIVGMKFIE